MSLVAAKYEFNPAKKNLVRNKYVFQFLFFSCSPPQYALNMTAVLPNVKHTVIKSLGSDSNP